MEKRRIRVMSSDVIVIREEEKVKEYVSGDVSSIDNRTIYSGFFPCFKSTSYFLVVYLFLVFCLHSVQYCFFFFSSRRRHTRSLCDWSSDVCSFFFKQKTAYEITV